VALKYKKFGEGVRWSMLVVERGLTQAQYSLVDYITRMAVRGKLMAQCESGGGLSLIVGEGFAKDQ
jgi:hypothetical protein